MPAAAPEMIEMNGETVLAHGECESLALVDVETYPAFVGAKADRLDMMAHLSEQMRALTVLSWKAPETARRFRLLLTENDFLVERIGRSHPAQIASGNLRIYGRVCFATHEYLYDCARHRTHDLLKIGARSKIPRPQLLEVPPGVYAVTLYYHAPFQEGQDVPETRGSETEIDYTVILRHYAFPPPRVAPVRLSAGFLPWVGEEAASEAFGGATSHKAPGVGVPRMAS
jgi:hypothetical protein